jgi:hypothetical protein
MEITTTHAVHPFTKSGLGLPPFRVVAMSNERIPNGDGTFRCGATCDHCGTGIVETYHVVSADGKASKVGNVCVEKTADADLIREKYAARQRFDATAGADKAAEFLASAPALAANLQLAHPVIQDIAAKLQRYGSISTAQIALVARLAAEFPAYEATQKALAEEKARAEAKAATRQPVATGKRTVEGVVVDVWGYSTRFGYREMMRIELADGATVEGTYPSKFEGGKGDRISMVVNVERDAMDEFKGHYKNPAKVKTIPAK